MRPLISIVIPSNNRTELLDEAILSIITDPSWNSNCELCISDNSEGYDTQNLIRTKYNDSSQIVYRRSLDEKFNMEKWGLDSLNKKIRLIAMVPVIEDYIHQKADVVNSFGLDIGQRHYNFAEKHQFHSWKQDTFENIRDEFLELVGSVPPQEKSENLDKGVNSFE